MQELWKIYQELNTNWKGYIVVVARLNRIDPEDLYDAVINHLIDFKVDNLKKLISNKARELKYRKEIPISKFQVEDEEEERLLEHLQFRNYKEIEEKPDKLSKLPEELKTYLLSRVRIEKTLPIQERIKFRQKLREAQQILGGQ